MTQERQEHRKTRDTPPPPPYTGFMPSEIRRLVVGITGSSSTLYGIRFLQVLSKIKHLDTHLVMSESAGLSMNLEIPEWTRQQVEKLAKHVHQPTNLAASISSGSFQTQGMVIIPCSMKTLGNIAHSTGGDLLCRAADVTLKERRPLIIVPRETPLHLGHLRNMIAVTEMGAVMVPPIPAFYHRPRTIEDMIDHTLGKILDLLKIDHQLFKRWS